MMQKTIFISSFRKYPSNMDFDTQTIARANFSVQKVYMPIAFRTVRQHLHESFNNLTYTGR